MCACALPVEEHEGEVRSHPSRVSPIERTNERLLLWDPPWLLPPRKCGARRSCA